MKRDENDSAPEKAPPPAKIMVYDACPAAEKGGWGLLSPLLAKIFRRAA